MSHDTDSPKVCTRCKFTCAYEDAYTYFNRNKSRKDGYNGWCKGCLKGWRLANREKLLEQKRQYYQENKEQLLQKNYEWRRNNPEKRRASDRKYRKENRKERNKYNRELRKRKPKVFKELAKRYYDRKQALPDNFTEDDWTFCLEYWNNSCAVCGDTPESLHSDHWIAVSAEVDNHPGTTPVNIICLCHSCNSSKFNKDGYEWLVDLYGNVQADEIYGKIQAYFNLVGKGAKNENNNIVDEQGWSLQKHHRHSSGNRISYQGKQSSAD